MTDVVPFPRHVETEWLTAQQLADRWCLNVESIYRTPKEVLPYIEVPPGSNKPRRRYSMLTVLKYEREELAG